ncbi:MAG: bifunctional indole-3-glycerol-phosphate synthase TrpC/phosphoribosylanthranilate isomerase TrpF [Halobacteriovoraceae bacterium]|nr:bifunctional indole-3-glycerol-phosphate synthase TrpC/phosphoribosylanthranilate isomerase TrpF [Halobacteriovoraceae bacterium]
MKKNILSTIVEHKKIENELAKKSFSLDFLKSNCKKTNDLFYQILSIKKTHFILECKKGSPSRGIINPNYNPVESVKVYNQYASAISVLTDEKFFFGSFNDLKLVREVTTLPILCKDFVIDEYTIYRARFHGADAILLILEILTDEEYLNLSSIAHELGMGVLTEIATEQQALRANQLGSKVVGINNRNLKDFTIDLKKCERLAKLLTNSPVVISESGISNHAQIKENKIKADGFLIGTSLMKESNLDYACRSLIYGKNKVCGITSSEILAAVYEAGAAYAGINFIKTSPRFVEISKAIEITKNSPLPIVGIFCNQSIEEIKKVIENVPLQVVQLHGDENESYIHELKNQLPNDCKIWKAISADQIDLLNLVDVEIFVIDSRKLGQFGGTGTTFDWSILNNLPKEKILLAGGIGPANVKEASQIGCVGLDLNSKLENDDGLKDLDKIKETFKQIINY